MAKFKTRARTVDMLGRQQIANVSTAISELFKNAYDAYADHAEVDYFASDNLLVIRDDGIGMTPEEFESRWLVLGTESKFSQDGDKVNSYRPSDKTERAIMGEKGIGRLAIALLGRQVLILSRAEREDEEHDLVMCFIHWGVFEISGINLEDIEIPIKRFSGNDIPTEEDVEEILGETVEFIEALRNKRNALAVRSILKDISDFELDPVDLDEFLGGISLKSGKGGTHFYVAPADDGIALEIERENQRKSKDFTKFLLGFSNSLFRETPPPPIETAFRYWPTDTEYDDLIGDGEFFTEDELANADHRVSGRFDEFGQFQGNLRIFDKQYTDHIVSWKDGHGRPTKCGPFEVEFGYIQGAQRESSLAPDEWNSMSNKLNEIGGIYVYRDRIRILPYGNSDVDWLDIEERRTKSAGYYFFSYRRIFGAVKLTRESNGLLREKAGREGFQQDRVYRQLKAILENLFLQLAADFFRDTGEYSDYFLEKKEELESVELARRKRQKQVTTKRKNLAASLESFFERVNESLPETELSTLREAISLRMEAAAKMKDPDEASTALLEAEKDSQQRLATIQESYRLSKPRGVGLSKQLQRDWNAYVAELDRLEAQVFTPFRAEISETLGAVAEEARLYVNQRKRLGELIKQQAADRKKAVKREAGEVRDSANKTRSSALRVSRTAIREMQDTITAVESDFAQKDLTGLSTDEIEHLRQSLEGRIEAVGRKNQETLCSVRDMLTAMSDNLAQEDGILESDILAAMDQELEELREQTDSDAEMVQLGLAVAIINHEFEAAIKGVRRSLRELRPWANSNDELGGLYNEIRKNFDHLDGHLNLFTPLQRRLYRKAIYIKGSDIHHYLKTLFEIRLKRHEVKMMATEEFLDSQVLAFPSTIYPVFVNVVDNAMFWLKEIDAGKRITLDADENSFLISNNGPAISKRDYQAIFEQGFTRKPGGRGLGLFISQKALQKEGMDIVVLPQTEQFGVTLQIIWPQEDDID